MSISGMKQDLINRKDVEHKEGNQTLNMFMIGKAFPVHCEILWLYVL